MSSDSEILRTPDSAFVDLLDYPFQPNYIELSHTEGKKIRIHYLDEGNQESQETILLLHGEPSWSYLYRHFISGLKEFRVIAVDLIGFGKSDKLVKRNDYTYQRHVNWIREFIENLNLTNITLFCQDWGSLIGLQLVGTEGVSHRFARVAVGNGGLPTGDTKISDAFLQWQKYASEQTKMNVGSIIDRGVSRELKPEEISAYNAPFPDETYQAGALAFPSLVPTRPDDPASQFNRDAWKNLVQFSRPFVTLFSDGDPITAGGEKFFQKMIPGAQNQSHSIINDAGHFLQEDKPQEIVEHLIKFIQNNSLPSKL